MKTRTCTKCNHEYPETLKYYNKSKYTRADGTKGFNSRCRSCMKEYRTQRNRKLGIDRGILKERALLKSQNKKRCRSCNEIYPLSSKYFTIRKKGELGICRWCYNGKMTEKYRRSDGYKGVIDTNIELLKKGLRLCPTCKKAKSIKEFGKNNGYCKPCSDAHTRAYYRKAGEELSDFYVKHSLKRRGITPTKQTIEIARLIMKINREASISFNGKEYRTIRELYEDNKNILNLGYSGVLTRLSQTNNTDDLLLSSDDYKRKYESITYKVTCIQTDEVRLFKRLKDVQEWTRVGKSHLHKCCKEGVITRIGRSSKTDKTFKIEYYE